MFLAHPPQQKTGACEACGLRQAMPAMCLFLPKGCVRCKGDVRPEDADAIEEVVARLQQQLLETTERVQLLEEYVRGTKANAGGALVGRPLSHEDSRLLTS
jgi:hypothetical protein